MQVVKQRKKTKQYRKIGARTSKGRNKKIGKFLGAVLLVGCFLVVLFAGYKSFACSSVFFASNLSVNGCSRLDKMKILTMGGVDIHTNLLALRPLKVREKIEKHPWVNRVEVVRELPNTLTITVKEYKPVAMINLQNGLYYIDEKGTPFVKVMPGDDYDFPVITGLESKRVSDKIQSKPLAETLQFLKYAAKGDSILPKQNISEAKITEGEKIIVFLVDRPFPIYLGRGKMRDKYHRLAMVLNKLYKNEVFEETSFIRVDYAGNKVLVGKSGTG